jgi:hypothetical protein|tara:strand:+ start:663 stop:1319 length:657 start_codon:yes stop_codon:yes gene_type:complete
VGLFKSLKKIAKIAAPIAGSGIASILVPGSSFLAPALGGGIGALLQGQKPGSALLTGLTAGLGGKFLGGSKALSGLGKAAVPVASAAAASLPAIAFEEQQAMLKQMREMYPDRTDKELEELILKQTAKAPSNYEGFEDLQVESELIPKVAEGGVMDLRQGGMSLGPGTEKSDDIPAMLSDGEFVLTARAVRGIGNGSRQAGAKKLYQFMNQAEQNVPS